jgi:hypothetical protein
LRFWMATAREFICCGFFSQAHSEKQLDCVSASDRALDSHRL